jgi:hypothetical protein
LEVVEPRGCCVGQAACSQRVHQNSRLSAIELVSRGQESSAATNFLALRFRRQAFLMAVEDFFFEHWREGHWVALMILSE